MAGGAALLAALAALLVTHAAAETVLAEQQAEARRQAVQHEALGETILQRNDQFLAAAKQGNATWLLALLEAGADVHTYNPDGFTALYWAAWKGCEPCVELLIDAGADVSTQGTSQHNVARRIARRDICMLAGWESRCYSSAVELVGCICDRLRVLTGGRGWHRRRNPSYCQRRTRRMQSHRPAAEQRRRPARDARGSDARGERRHLENDRA